MQSIWTRVAVLAALAAAVALFVVLSGEDDSGSDDEAVTTVTEQATEATAEGPSGNAPVLVEVRDGNPVGGVREIVAGKGEPVNVEVQLDPAEEEVHVHGYEIAEPAQSGRVRMSFTADLEGVFEVEVHRADGSDVQIAELRVTP
jgi:hypothetical protein